MNSIRLCHIVSLFLVFGSCTVKLTSVKDKSAEQIKTGYRVIRDLSYGPDQEQGMDIYISRDAKKLKRRNFTVVFVHGGGYYVSGKSKEEKYIEPYLEKGMNVVNINA